jgi:hypothetical protein
MALRGAARKTSKRREYEVGVSVYDNYEHLAALMRLNKFYHGRYIATLDLPDDGTCEVAKTFSDPHHYTIYLSEHITPRMLLSYISGGVKLIS